MTDQNEWESELADSSELEFDPAKRRHGRKGHLNAGLRRWMAAHKKGRKFDRPRHRRGRRVKHVVYDRPRHHRHRRARSLGRSFHMPHFRRRRSYDFGRPGGWLSAASGDITTTAGGQFHNFLTQKVGLGSKVYKAPSNFGPLAGMNVTMLGAATWALNILGKKFGFIKQDGNIDLFLRGMNSESFNIPLVENVQRVNTGMAAGSSVSPAGAPLATATGTGPAFSPSPRIGSAVNMSYVPAFAYN